MKQEIIFLFLISPRPVFRKIHLSRGRNTLIRLDWISSYLPAQREGHLGQNRKGRPLTSPEGLGFGPGWGPPGWKGALYCSSGPAAPRAGSRGLGLPTGAEAMPRSQARSPSVSTCAQSPRVQGWRLPHLAEKHARPLPGKEASGPRPAHNRQAALSPRPEECLADLARSVRPSPHIVWVPAGELADILVHVLEALFGLF